jgi:hypothetical protein
MIVITTLQPVPFGGGLVASHSTLFHAPIARRVAFGSMTPTCRSLRTSIGGEND